VSGKENAPAGWRSPEARPTREGLVSTTSIDLGLTLVNWADRVEEDHYLVDSHAVDLETDACSCGQDACWHIVAATIHQARWNSASKAREGVVLSSSA
jgi:hypothetical protein